VLGVVLDEDGWQVVRPFLAKTSVNYRVILGKDEVANLHGGIDALPTKFVLDREGRIAASHVGLIDRAIYKNDIEEVL
jgi:cytochrome c biogenesis protein CcmG/thiol:disulfide interchange protein DsbE